MSTWIASSPPDAAIEISPEAVAVAALSLRGRDAIVSGYAVEPLPPGAVVANLSSPNIVDRPAVVGALRTALERASLRPRRVALVVPDLAGRVSLVRFDRIPERREDLDQLVKWQVRKAAPFPIDDAALSYSPGARTADGGGEFVVVMARREIVRDYELVCEELGLHAGVVDLSTLSVLNLFLAADPPQGDWLTIHIRPHSVSMAILRGRDMIFFRNGGEDEEHALADVVHQTSMYYQDRLGGQQFVRVLFGGIGTTPAALEQARRSVEERLGLRVEPIDPTRVATLNDRLSVKSDLQAMLAPLVGMLLRTRKDAVAA